VSACVGLSLIAWAIWSPARPPPGETRKKTAPDLPARTPTRLEDLAFADARLAARFRAFRDAAEAFAGSDWRRDELTVGPQYRGGPLDCSMGWYRTSQPEVDDMRTIQYRRPFRTITVHGSMANGTVQSASVSGSFMPLDGWGAALHQSAHLRNGQLLERLSIRVFAPGRGTATPSLILPATEFTADLREGKRSWRVAVQIADAPGFVQSLTYTEGALPLGYLAAEAEFLAFLARVLENAETQGRSKILKGEVEASTINWTGVRSDNPPREFPAAVMDDLTPPQRDALADDLSSKIAALRKLSADHGGAISAAIRQTCPLEAALKGVRGE
jgi:hypothetical protein